MGTSDSDRNPVEELAEEFVARYRRGERPALTEYTDRYPQWADKIRALFPALVVMERVRPGPHEDAGAPCTPRPDAGRVERVGDYRILRELGRGGMGVVYEAEQESLGRHVALKVLPVHTLADPRHLQRFKREARAAARLHHSNIVPVHGVGEQDGLSYYVMQFIQGQGLDQVLLELRRLRQVRQVPTPAPAAAEAAPGEAAGELCAAAVARSLLTGQFATDASPGAGAPPWAGRCMTEPRQAPGSPAGGEENAGGTRAGSSTSVHLPGQSEGSALSESGWPYWHSVARIGLQVADALAYASSQGILHRDIKPSNLLLDTRGTVWVTDFGLAKADTDQENVTHTGDIVGTLRYMAPERFEGKADVRSDLYALGLTLYELLTLRPAFGETDRNKLVAQVLHDEPPRPRRLDPAIPRDLETVVQKAIARDPAQRYQTPAEMAEDLQRFLDDRPIRARRLGLIQRGWRWCRRNPALAIVSAGLIFVMLGGVAGIGWQWRRAENEATNARSERNEANQNFALARQAVEDYLAKVTENKRLKEADFHALRKELLQAALPFYEQFVRQTKNDPALRADQGRAYERLGQVRQLLGEMEPALANYREMQAIFEELTQLHPEIADYHQSLGQAYYHLGEALQKLGRLGEAEKWHAQALIVQRGLADRHPDVAEYRRDVAFSHFSRALVLAELGRRDETIAEYRESLILHEQLAREFPADPDYRRRLAWSHNNLGNNLCETGRYVEGEPEIRKALAIKEQLVRDYPAEPEYRVSAANSHIALGNLYHRRQQAQAAEAEESEALRILDEVARQFPSVPDYQSRLAQCHTNLGNVLRDLGRRADATDQYQRGLRHYEHLAAAHPDIVEHGWGVANTRALLAWVLADQGSHRQAAAELRRVDEHAAGSGEARYNVACGWSLAFGAVLRDTHLPENERAELAEEFAALSLSWLKKAGEAGYFRDGANADWLRGDPNLVPALRSRPEFQKLLHEWERQKPGS
jgi:serine/threonine-protein kinase